MKKLLTIPILLGVICFTGCEKNRLECTQTTETITDIKTDTKYVYSFNNDKVKKVTMTTKITLNGDYNEPSFINSYNQMAESAVTGYNDVVGVSATYTSKKNVITVKVDMEPSLMGEEAVDVYGLNSTKDELMDELEDIGYTCK